jgi:antitoxin (DNA-binding transcriptional repressor) of toxin-antitoxin stability system
MSKVVNMHEAKTNFSKLAVAVEAGEEIVIARGGKPFMKLVKFEPTVQRQLGLGETEWEPPTKEEWAELDREVLATFRDL